MTPPEVFEEPWVSPCGRVTLYRGDCLDILPTLRPGSVLVTDPPYSSGGFNESGRSVGSKGTDAGYDPIEGDTMSTRGYQELMRCVLRASRSCAAYIFTDWRMWDSTTLAVQLGGYRARGMIVWDKKSPGMGVRWGMQHELIMWGTRVKSKGWRAHGNVISVARSGNKYHSTEKPVRLMETLLSNGEPGVVLDPFMGSGTTGVACIQTGRKFIGIELDNHYFEIAKKRIAAEIERFDGGPMFAAKPQEELFTEEAT